jgi:signal peptidase I
MIFEYLEDAMNRDTTFPRKLVVSQSYYEKSAINRGDIIYMEFSDSFIKEHFSITDQEQIQLYQRKVSRVIGLPGEVIHISKGQIYINNKKLDTFYGHQTFHNQPVASEEGLTMAKNIKVPENHVFVMPDEWWRGSVDSSGIGPIDHSYIKGKVVGYVTE